MVRPVLLYGNPLLRRKSEEVGEISDELIALIQDLEETMIHYEGVGLSAVQVGVLKRVFVFRREENGELTGNVMTMVDPVITDERGGYQKGLEGCLSLPKYSGDIKRPAMISVNWWEIQKGTEIKKIERSETFVEQEARIIIHEIDHLEGKLIVDTLSLAKKKRVARYYKKVFKKMLTEARRKQNETKR